MLRKTLFVGAGAALLLTLVMGRSHIFTTAGIVKQAVRDSVPIEYEIKRSRQMISDLEPEVRRNMHLIAREEVEVAKLAKLVSESEASLAKAKEEILRLKGDLDQGGTTFVYAGRNYTAKQVKTDLTNRFARYETKESSLTSNQKMLDARRRGLDAARQNLEEMLAARTRLEVEVENLEARLKMVEVANTKSQFALDDSQLSRAKELIADIQARIEVAEKLANAEGDFHEEIPLSVTVEEDVCEKIAAKFGGEQPAESPSLARINGK